MSRDLPLQLARMSRDSPLLTRMSRDLPLLLFSVVYKTEIKFNKIFATILRIQALINKFSKKITYFSITKGSF